MTTWIGYSEVLRDAAGAIAPGATITVRKQSDGTTATLASNAAGASQANPFTAANADGIMQFFIRPGLYNVEAALGGNTLTWPISISPANQVQSSSTDTTTDRLMAVGAFGLGNAGAAVVANIDAFTTRAGFYSVNADTTGTRPAGASSFASLIVTRHATTGIVQVYVNSNGEVLAFRSATNDVWTAWRTIYSTDNILDALSQSGGVPTGGILFRGSNSNGQFQMYADGTMVCTRSMTSSDAAAVAWTFPSAFSATPEFCTAQPQADAARAGSVSSVSNTGFSFSSWNTSDGTRVASNTYLMARGRWF